MLAGCPKKHIILIPSYFYKKTHYILRLSTIHIIVFYEHHEIMYRDLSTHSTMVHQTRKKILISQKYENNSNLFDIQHNKNIKNH